MKKSLTDSLINWYLKDGRDLPWRNTKDPYKIWLSEIILQQTRVNQGIEYYFKFIENYPDIWKLASSDEEQVLRDWQGLGYYSRARNLLKCAKEITIKQSGVFPKQYSDLLKLPGIGKYTASAISSFAFDRAEAVVDGNVYRVLSRLYVLEYNIADPKNYKYFHSIATELLPVNAAANFNQAIMELGALICTPKKPKCNKCPVAEFCIAKKEGRQLDFPVKMKNIKKTTRFFYYVLWEQDGKIPMKKRSGKDIWHGMFDFKLIESSKTLTAEEAISSLEQHIEFHDYEISDPVKHILSHQTIYAQFILLKPTKDYDKTALENINEPDLEYFTIESTKNLPKPILIDKYLKQQFY